MDIRSFMLAAKQRKVSMVTCYDALFAEIVNGTAIDSVLVGDSVGMVMHGFESTLPVTVDIMQYHVAAVARVLRQKLIVADMPFLSYQQGLTAAMQSVSRLMQAGAHAVKLEGCDGHVDIVQRIVQAGVPVMGHLGLTPQSVHQLGGYKVQGRNEQAAEAILRQARDLQQAGCFALVLECVPVNVARNITAALEIPTIGIGAGPDTSGQVLVMHDLLGLQQTIRPKFLKQYMNGFDLVRAALTSYDDEVKQQTFPLPEHSYE